MSDTNTPAKGTFISQWSDRQRYRLLEIAPGALVWATLVAAVILSWLTPLWAVIFILIFDVYWLIRVLYVMLYVVLAYRNYRRSSRVDWQNLLEQRADWQKVSHLVIIPTFREPLAVLESTLTSLTKMRLPANRLIVVLATEERDAAQARQHAVALQARFGESFQRFIVTEHPANIPGEIAAKGANLTWAVQQVRPELSRMGIDPDWVVVSTFDADSVAHPQYFSYLTEAFLDHPDRWRTSYQPIPLFHNNVWEALFLMRVVASSTTFWLLSETVRADRLFTFSSHSLPLKALIDVGYWQTDVVNEDSRIFVQCFLHYDGQYSVKPLYLPISMDTVQGQNWWASIKNQYKQIQRWAYGGVENFPFTVWNFLHNRHLPLHTKLKYTWIQLEGIYSWATAPLLIFLLGWLPFAWAGPEYATSTLIHNGPAMIQTIMGLAMVGLLASAVLSIVMLPRRPTNAPWYRWVMMIGQWGFLPVTMILFGAIPAIDAQTRMMLGRYMGFVVTEKTRKADGSQANLVPTKPG